MRILMIGDVVGEPGRKAIHSLVPGLRREFGIDVVIANGENMAGGFGITPDTAEELMNSEVDVITSGNHIWKHKEIVPYINEEWPLIRPANYPPGAPGRGIHPSGRRPGGQSDGESLYESSGLPFQDG